MQPTIHVIPTTVVCVLSQTMPYLEGFQRHKCHLYVLLSFALTCWLVRKLPCFVVMAELSYRLTSLLSHSQNDLSGFHLQLLVFPFIYPFNSRIRVLVQSSFANEEFRRISTTFQHHFKICLLWFLQKKNVAFTLISFAVLYWNEMIVYQCDCHLSY